ncbi:hypothetical protein C8R43DRAFT_1017474 [Mycena crocata]|nr:hypothetical protein C8R43DRAFT_1017474 [Mycena crocata]
MVPMTPQRGYVMPDSQVPARFHCTTVSLPLPRSFTLLVPLRLKHPHPPNHKKTSELMERITMLTFTVVGLVLAFFASVGFAHNQARLLIQWQFGRAPQAMRKFKKLVVVLTLFAVTSSAQEHAAVVTLWQFGQNRLLTGAMTQALQPIGTTTHAGVAATTYLYQVKNTVITQTPNASNDLEPITLTTATPRTIAASASGWVEYFPSRRIICNFIRPDFGQCVDAGATITTIGNSGTPNPVVLTVGPPLSQPSPPSFSAVIGSMPTSTASTSASTADPGPGSHKPVGVIVGAAVGGCAALVVSLALLLIRRRRGSRRGEKDMAPRAYNIARTSSDNLRAVRPAASKFAPSSGRVSSSQDNVPPTADLSATELARMLFQRVHAHEIRGEEPPPEYPV